MDCWEIFSSRPFVGIYIFILLAEFVWLFLLVLRADGKNAKQKSERVVVVPSDRVAGNARKSEKNPSAGEDGEENPETRFASLTDIDQKARTEYGELAYRKGVTLASFCEAFRHFAADKLGLYYDISDVRRFIANMTVTRILIMQGMSGTGKTSMAYAFGKFIENDSSIIPIQPMWKERTDMLGYYNEFTKRFNESDLLKKMYEASYNRRIYIVVLDEMNIARVEYYFAEFLSLLEIPKANERYLEVVTDHWQSDPKHLERGKILLPSNMWFIGTANNDDSTFAISDKVYDRAMIMNLDKKAQFFEAREQDTCPISADRFTELAEGACEEYSITARNRRRIAVLDDYLMKQFRVTVGNRIMRQIDRYVPAYIACGGEELEAIDDILAKKLFRKFEALNPVTVRSELGKLYTFLDELFGENSLPVCKAYLHRFEVTS